MPKDFDPDLVDPSVTAEEIERAHDAEPADFPDVEEQDDLDELGEGAITPATPREAIQHARALTEDDTFVGVGYCLRTVRDPEYRVPALWPDAETAWENGAPQHRTSDPVAIPRGAPVYWTNGRHGHIALSLGGGLCRTTDYHRPGYVDVALISRLAPWCGGQLVGWAETLNGYDVWPDPKKPKPAPRAWTLADRRAFIHRRLLAAREAGRDTQAARLKAWQDRMDAKLEAQKA